MFEQLTAWLSHAESWVFITFVIFCAVAWKMGRKGAVAGLDNYIETVKARLKEAEDLRNEAQALADEYKNKHANALATAQAIVDDAKIEASKILERGEADIKARLNVRQKQFDDELLRFEEQAFVELKTHMANLIEEYARQRLVAELSAETQNALVDRAIETARAEKPKAA